MWEKRAPAAMERREKERDGMGKSDPRNGGRARDEMGWNEGADVHSTFY